jgi:O-antigen/teichoic acid export membrane protein
VSAWTSIDAILFQRSATFFLGRYSTADQIGYYGLAYGIAGTLVMTLPLAMAGVLMPAMSRYFGAGDRVAMQRVYSTATRYLVILSLPLSFGCIAVAKPLVGILYGSDYLAMAMPLRILLFSSAVSAMAGPGSALFLALGKPYLAAVWGIPLALLNLALAFALVPYHGATGAALANSACQVLGVAVATSYLLHFEHFRLPLSAILRTVLAASISAGLAYLVAQQTTGWPGLLAAITLGAVVYVVALIFSGALDASDFLLLRQMTNVLPNRIGIIVGKLVNLSEEASRRSGRFSRVRAF